MPWEENSPLLRFEKEGDHEPRNVGNFLKMEEARFPTEPPEWAYPVNTFILIHWDPCQTFHHQNCKVIICVVIICYSSHRKAMQSWNDSTNHHMLKCSILQPAPFDSLTKCEPGQIHNSMDSHSLKPQPLLPLTAQHIAGATSLVLLTAWLIGLGFPTTTFSSINPPTSIMLWNSRCSMNVCRTQIQS